MDLAELVLAAVFERDEGRRADRRQRPGGLRASAAKRIGNGNMARQPGRTLGPLDPDFTANALRRAILDQLAEGLRFLRRCCGEERTATIPMGGRISKGLTTSRRMSAARCAYIEVVSSLPVSQQNLDHADIDLLLKQVRGEAVA